MKVLVIGSTGMLGHIVKKHFMDKGYEVFGTTRKEKNFLYFNPLENINKIEEIFKEIKPNVVINCMGVLNKYAEENKCESVLINSYLPHYLDKLSYQYNYKFVHISTDCVFDGKKGKYSEYSVTDASSFYGKSKALGEIIEGKNLTLRTSIIGPDLNVNGIGLFNWFMSVDKECFGYVNAIWTGVTTLELAKQIEIAVLNDLKGLFHVVNNESISKYDLLILLNNYMNRNIIINRKEDYVCDKSLIVKRNDFLFNIPSYDEMIKEMCKYIRNNSILYKNYKLEM